VPSRSNAPVTVKLIVVPIDSASPRLNRPALNDPFTMLLAAAAAAADAATFAMLLVFVVPPVKAPPVVDDVVVLKPLGNEAAGTEIPAVVLVPVEEPILPIGAMKI